MTNDSYSLVHRYYDLKKKLLNLPDMTLADIYAPMPGNDKIYSWEQAKELVLRNAKNIDPELYELTKSIFDRNRIDAAKTEGREGGAYCGQSIPEIDPFVFTTYNGKYTDVTTLAHELGHAVHFMLSAKENPNYLNASLPIAETASTFSEMRLADLVLGEETDPNKKIAIISEQLEGIMATSHRQNMFNNFEIEIHKAINEKGKLSPDELCSIYQKELNRMFGDSVKQPEEFKYEWASIPHMFAAPFYVNSYNFANLITISLFQKVKEDSSFIGKYKAFLSKGSSADVKDIAKSVGIDITDPEFWRAGFRYVEDLIDQLKTLIQERNKPKLSE